MSAVCQDNKYVEKVRDFLRTRLGYTHIPASQLDFSGADASAAVMVDELRIALTEINSHLHHAAIDEAIDTLLSAAQGSLLAQNKAIHGYLQSGIYVSYYEENQQCHAHVRVLDGLRVEKNRFHLVEKLSLGIVEDSEDEEKQPEQLDMVIYVNGLPLITLILQSTERLLAGHSEAFGKVERLKEYCPAFLAYNAFCVLSCPSGSKSGTITADEDRYMAWKVPSSKRKATGWETHLRGMLEKARLLELIQHYICYSGEYKMLAGYHQYGAVKAALKSTHVACAKDGRAGVFWHTQGSGKSLSMIFFAKQLLRSITLESPTIVVVTDRTDLDNQLFAQFALCDSFLHTQPVRARNRAHLRQLLHDRKVGGIIFSTLQKFDLVDGESDQTLCDRRNVVVIADEAHRSQYGLIERVGKRGQVLIGAARKLRLTLPNASFIGFTGTPIARRDRSTRDVFGNYVDIYDMAQAVEDGTTCPVYYESRVPQLQLDEQTLTQLDVYYKGSNTPRTELCLEESLPRQSRLEAILSRDDTIASLCDDIIQHYEQGRAQTGKAMIVAYSRAAAMKMRDYILSQRPDWHSSTPALSQSGKLAVVMSRGKQDPPSWLKLIGSETEKEQLERRFKDSESPLQIVIVVDMWLTGFDIPPLSTMYMYKPMRGHSLMQAIARVNRVYKGKQGGLIVDYIGIAKALEQAMSDYTSRGKQQYHQMNVSGHILSQTRKKLEVCEDLFASYDYQPALSSDNSELSMSTRSDSIDGGVNYLLDVTSEEARARKIAFLEESQVIARYSSLCASLLEESERLKIAYFLAVRSSLSSIEGESVRQSRGLHELSERLYSLLCQSKTSRGVIDLFAHGCDMYSICDSEYLDELAQMEHRNLVVRLLEQLFKEKIRHYRRVNYIRSEQFAKQLRDLMQSYYQNELACDSTIERIRQLAQEFKSCVKAGEKLNLSEEEYAFYDALTKPSSVLELFDPEGLITITRELTQKLRLNSTHNWHRKESMQAKMRREIKRHLSQHGFPHKEREEVLATIMRQCKATLK